MLPSHLELTLPELDHDRNLQIVASKQDRFSPSNVVDGRGLTTRRKYAYRNSLSLVDDPDVARISRTIEAHITARLASILETLHAPPFRPGATTASCVCFRDGAFFRRHIDALEQGAGKRRLTWVYYLNAEPKRFSGGDLVLYRRDERPTVIEAAHGRIVVFRSKTAHEVTPVRLSPDRFEDARFTLTGFIADEPSRVDRLKAYARSLRDRLLTPGRKSLQHRGHHLVDRARVEALFDVS
jgi:Rps23 Pro-64 3,4-dihydroxylase Tpa1-like proline 4-hydroxylase